MDSIPDAVVQYILSYVSSVKDVASCNCVSNKWKDSMTYRKSLCFPSDIFDNLTAAQTPDSILMRMLSSVSRLEELVVSCPFTIAGLASWLLLVGSSLKNLELRMPDDDDTSSKLDCIQAARNLESLKIWNVSTLHAPKWDVFKNLRNLEMEGEKLEDSVLTEALRATPNLTQLVLHRCRPLRTLRIELLELQRCNLHFGGPGVCSLTLIAPKIEYLEVQGCREIRVPETSCLKNLSIKYIHAKGFSSILFGQLMALESLLFSGHINLGLMTNMLKCAREVKHLILAIIWVRPYPVVSETDVVDLFKTLPKLKYFHMSAAIFSVLSHGSTLKNVGSRLVIPCLERVLIQLSWPVNVEENMSTIESLVRYAKKLKEMTVVVFLFGDVVEGIDDFLDELRRTLVLISSSLSLRLQVNGRPTTESRKRKAE